MYKGTSFEYLSILHIIIYSAKAVTRSCTRGFDISYDRFRGITSFKRNKYLAVQNDGDGFVRCIYDDIHLASSSLLAHMHAGIYSWFDLSQSPRPQKTPFLEVLSKGGHTHAPQSVDVERLLERADVCTYTKSYPR